MPFDYAVEAERYDATRGGQERAEAAAAAIIGLVPVLGTVLDVAGGTGIVSRRMAARGHRVAVIDLIPEMLRLAQARLPGVAACMDASRLAVADASIDTVTMVWLLHLVPNVEPLIADAARVLRSGGHLVTTVDKAAANGEVRENPSDARAIVTGLAAVHGLVPAGETSFVGVGQRGGPVYTLLSFVRVRPQ
ncbi:MAG: class I SAM-dependent methyltransferase [Dermatophilaceae bacterium]